MLSALIYFCRRVYSKYPDEQRELSIAWFIYYKSFIMTLKVMTLLLFRSSKFAAYFQNTFSEHIWTAASHYYWHWFSCVVYILFKQYFFCVQVEFVTEMFLSFLLHLLWSSLLYNSSDRHGRHECDTNDQNATRVRKERHEYYTNDTSAARVKNFDFDNEKSENILSHHLY